jgi:2-polyprenylphenol 6-hydroxylase
MKKQECHYDIIIAGAGIVGLTFACNLINYGLRIAVLDKSPDAFDLQGQEPGAALRVSVMTPASQQNLMRLQVWPRLDAKKLSSFSRVEVWEQATTPAVFFDAAEVGQPYLGTVVKNYDLQSALLTQAKTDRHLDWFPAASIQTIQCADRSLILSLAEGSSLTTKLLVGADGMHSYVRNQAGMQAKIVDYHQRAIIASVKTELGHAHTARQIFLSTGPLAFLPLTNDHFCSIVWSINTKEAERLLDLSDDCFCLELANAFEYHLGKITWASTRLSFPLKMQESEAYIKNRIALIGDAAHTIHPLAGQGANLGIADAICLAKVILANRQKQRDWGALPNLRPYERERHFYHRLMGSGIDLIKRVFATKSPFLRQTRHLGLSFIEKSQWTKNWFMRYAMGNLQD